MLHRFLSAIIVAFLFFLNNYALGSDTTSHWKGYAILGNGNICAVYSDDPKLVDARSPAGIHHLYYKNYSADYVKSTSFNLLPNYCRLYGEIQPDSVGMTNFFTTYTKTFLEDNTSTGIECFVGKEDVVVQKYQGSNMEAGTGFRYTLIPQNTFISDDTIRIISKTIEDSLAIIRWSNNVCMAVKVIGHKVKFSFDDSTLTIVGEFVNSNATVLLALDSSKSRVKQVIQSESRKNLKEEAMKYWSSWINTPVYAKNGRSFVSDPVLNEYYKRTLYAVKSACINGQIPADMTGQFVTNNMPQLYPRDAMKCARVFLKTGHYKEAKDIISFWVNNAIPKKSKGEFFARYDAKAQAVDGGSGARYDEPEWDANGYLIQLLKMYYDIKHEWLAPKEFIYGLADFLISRIDREGLLYEGGIVEWTAYLPTTNMVCSAALTTASDYAKTLGDDANYIKYKAGARFISENLIKTFDVKDSTLKAIRFHGNKAADNRSITEESPNRLFMWDGTMQFGTLWGYPKDNMLRSTIDFYYSKLIKNGGGMQYFQALDPGLAGYGGDCFFFTTASLSQYFSLVKQKDKALKLLQWMCRNSNSYGLMPERIYLNQTGCSEASPLSWCNAEFALAVQEYLTMNAKK
jgi:GH15 family glucan-1,4-alpha-glucosidase